MNRQIFIDTLRRALYGRIADSLLEDHIRYYDGYFAQEMGKGRSEQEILEELGDPKLIAKTILETSQNQNTDSEYAVINEDGQPEENTVQIHQIEGWKAALILAAVVAVILLISIIVFRVVVFFLPFLIVIAVAGWIIRKIMEA
jgi:uncharacterized membrane protein